MREATLPHGILRSGERRRDALVRAPTGADEALLTETLGRATAAERASALLAACVTRLAGQQAGIADVRELVAGDREALLLHLRAAAFGGRVPCVLDCPACGERMDLELAVGDLLVDEYPDPAVRHAVATDGAPVSFRLPTGADLEAAARAPDAEAGAVLLLDRCVLDDRTLSDAARAAVEDELERLDPQAGVHIGVACPSCDEQVDASVDASTLMLDELAASADALFREVHALARHYHWSEREILGLELPRRRRYLELLVDDEGVQDGAP
jgi:hypothetical protein